jgi:hypothetical protein
LEEIAEMTTWLREAIQTHQLANDVPIDTEFGKPFSYSQLHTALSYKKIKLCLIKKSKHMATIS